MDKLGLALLQRPENVGFRLLTLGQNFFKQLKTVIFQQFSERIDLVLPFERLFEDVLLKDTCAFDSIREDHDTDTVLDALIPHAHVDALIGPAHDTISMALILSIVALVTVTGFPFKDAVAVLFIGLIHALV